MLATEATKTVVSDWLVYYLLNEDWQDPVKLLCDCKEHISLISMWFPEEWGLFSEISGFTWNMDLLYFEKLFMV